LASGRAKAALTASPKKVIQQNKPTQLKGISMTDPHSHHSGASTNSPTPEADADATAQDAVHDKPPGPKFITWLKRLQVQLLVLLVIVICFSFLLVGLLLVPLTYFWSEKKEQEVVSSLTAGRVLSVSQTTGLFTRGLVQTDTGFFSLVDGVSLRMGEALTLETRANLARYLCDSQHRCIKLTQSFGPG
jgi:hypothetical protein